VIPEKMDRTLIKEQQNAFYLLLEGGRISVTGSEEKQMNK
jgi:hypothetical protein